MKSFICPIFLYHQVGLKSNKTNQLLVYTDDGNLHENNLNTTKKTTEALTDTNKEVGPDGSAETTTYMLLSLRQNAGQNHDLKIANRSTENMAKFRYSYLDTTIKI
jgi:hypothetical protein